MFNKNGIIIKNDYNIYQRNMESYRNENVNHVANNGISASHGIIIEISKKLISSEILEPSFIGNNERIKKILDFKFVQLQFNGLEYLVGGIFLVGNQTVASYKTRVSHENQVCTTYQDRVLALIEFFDGIGDFIKKRSRYD